MEISTDKTELLATKRANDAKTKHRIYIFIIIVFGTIIITLFILNLYQAGYLESDEETISITECSGNGHSYNDLNTCVCFQCYSGDNCEIETSDCTISAGSGQPYVLIEYWTEQVRKNKIKPMVIPADWRMPYDYNLFGPFDANDNNGLGGQLNQIIRSIHSKYHNVNLTDSYLVFGPGGTGVQTATYAAYSELLQTQIIAFDEVPYYFGYPSSCSAAGENRCVFSSSTDLIDEGNIVEFVTIPNNPDGFERERVYTNSSNWAYDLVYYWPHYIDANELIVMDAPISFFSATKLTGHASTRFGWAFVKNFELATYMTKFISGVESGFPVDSAHRAYQFLNHIEEYGDEFFEFTRNKMKQRFDILLDILSDQSNYISRGRSGAFFAWIECINKNETQVMNLFRNYNMRPIAGSNFGASVSPNSFVRIGMNQFEGNFVKMMDGMRLLVDDER
eukprot:64888_1